MDKVYFKEGIGFWLEDLSDIYLFKAKSFSDEKEFNLILSWYRGVEIPEDEKQIVRIYDVEIDEEKVFFNVSSTEKGFIVKPQSPSDYEKFINNKNILFTGEIIQV